eukprot:364091-Chlamydomonas_euryale.AAC.1
MAARNAGGRDHREGCCGAGEGAGGTGQLAPEQWTLAWQGREGAALGKSVAWHGIAWRGR